MKIALTMASVLVMSVTGYAWAAMQGLVTGLTMTDVIGAEGGGDKPADGARDILLVGMDSRTDAQGNPLPEDMLAKLRAGVADGELNTDTLIFVHIPNDGSKAVAFSLPRDSYVDIPGHGKHKINSAYARGKLEARAELQEKGVTDPKELEVRGNQEGAKTLIATVERLTGSTIDNYASINLLGFYEITQAIGGVDVCLKRPTKDPYSGANFTAGPQTVSGFEALAFVRQRHGLLRGDLDRVVRQQVFMAGLARKILSAGTLSDPGKLNDLVKAVQKSVVLNQGWDILAFAEQMKGLTAGQIEFRTIPVVNSEYSTPEDGEAVQVDPKQVMAFVQGSTGPTQPADAGPDNAEITVDVRNASGRTGLAAGVSRSLAEQGFTEGAIGNATSRTSTVVRVPPGAQAAGRKVADALDGNPEVEEDRSVPAGHAVVLLGTDYASSDTTNRTTDRIAAAPPAQSAPPPEEEQPITADGVVCVN
ncbi:cell envelope-related function transcriptional attenuator common domain-containing protein [Amycolatopsis arida]|uniref:Cell envelope-related function transcriptional attenuator common domain-containing protein n=1 Tax=Amycolatopsis arida TaxID=587909 RepID=A0A1I5NYJ5_9PSEU|nr:LCP family protein required for cell wall assembly [Amycolatopsis arida]SFP26845.1 cell envelope-related function transcriptional attenuator common domain-containing protein [Amycolatopsis arida]